MGKGKYSDESLFCAKYLQEKGYLSEGDLNEMSALLDDLKVDFELVKVEKNFYVELAERLRELWPTGNKDNKYPWRDSVENISQRLKHLWVTRKLKEYTIDECLTVARKYLAQFEEDTKYMRVLKYFIYKSKPAYVKENGLSVHQYESIFADMLESLTDEQRQQIELEKMFGLDSLGQGTII